MQRKLTIEHLKTGIETYLKKGKEYKKIANQYTNMFDWWKNQSKQNILKMTVLGRTILDSLNHAICYSAIHGFDSELEYLQFKIDKDFIDQEAKKTNWKEILRNQLWNRRQGITRISEWDKNHPFLKTFVEKEMEDKMIFKNELKKRINFYSSHNNFEIRIADIVATINRRYMVKKECNLVFKKLRLSSFSRGLYNHLILTMTPDTIYNPFD